MRRRKKNAAAIQRAQLVGLARLGIGAGMVVAPQLTARAWLGESPSRRSTIVLRGLGVREIAIGIGLLNALDRGAPVDGWLEAGAMSDAADSLLALGSGAIPGGRRLVAVVTAGAAAVWGLQLAEELD